METLAVVAYRQPVLRADIEAVRGVQCGEILRQLMERDLVKIVGRSEELGRPFLYGTTRRFLQVFGLRHLDELPRPDLCQPSPPRTPPAGHREQDGPNKELLNQPIHTRTTEGDPNVKIMLDTNVIEKDAPARTNIAIHEPIVDVAKRSDDEEDEFDDEEDEEDDDDEDDDDDDDDLDGVDDEDLEEDEWEEVDDEDADEDEDEDDDEDDDWDDDDEDDDWDDDEDEDDDWDDDDEDDEDDEEKEEEAEEKDWE
jgi:segregation and condensation protein B